MEFTFPETLAELTAVPAQFQSLYVAPAKDGEPFVLAKDDPKVKGAIEAVAGLSTTLKKVQLRKDLHTILARTVIEARQHLGITTVVNERSDATPIAELAGDITPRIEMVPDEAKSQVVEKLRGLKHYLPFFGRKR